MSTTRSSFGGVVVLAVVCLFATFTSALFADEERTASSLMSANVVAYIELTETDSLIAHLLDREFGKRIQEVPALKAALQSNQFKQGLVVLTLAEIGLNTTWREFTQDFTAGGVYGAVEANGNPVLLVKAKSGEWLDQAREKVMNIVRTQAKRNGNSDPIKESNYRDLTMYQVGEAWLGYVGDWLIVTQHEKTCHQVIDRFLDGADATLADNKRFRQAKANAGENLAWAFVDAEKIRPKNAPDQLKYTDNILAEILFGGILDVIRNTPYATSNIKIEGRKLAWEVAAPFDAKWSGESRQHFFGKQGKGEAPLRLQTKRHLASMAAYRDISQAWLRYSDLMTEKAADGLAQADATLATFFGGKDFGDDILSTLTPQVQLIVSGQDFEEFPLKPTIKLPAFALVGTLRDVKTMKPELRRVFLSFVGFLNVVGAMEGNMQLNFDIQEDDDTSLLTSSFLPIKGKDDQRVDEAPIQFNFSPSVAFRGDRFVISSSKALAKELATAKAVQTTASNTDIYADGEQIGAILKQNLESLIGQNMLNEGHTREQAEQEINIILTIVSAIRGAELRLVTDDDLIRVKLQLEVSGSSEGTSDQAKQ